jgi:hypothetical protein
MPTNITGSSTGVVVNEQVTMSAPADGDQMAAASVLTPFQRIANYLQYIKTFIDRIVSIYDTVNRVWVASQYFHTNSSTVATVAIQNDALTGVALSVQGKLVATGNGANHAIEARGGSNVNGFRPAVFLEPQTVTNFVNLYPGQMWFDEPSQTIKFTTSAGIRAISTTAG